MKALPQVRSKVRTSIKTIRKTQSGLTLIELLVAMLLTGFIVLAAVTSLIVARRGFVTVDAASQLRDNGRFASDLIQRLAGQSGFLDIPFAVNAVTDAAGTALPPPYVFGFNNAILTTAATPAAPLPVDALDGNRPTQCGSITDTSCVNGSDILVMRYQTPATVAGGALGDNSTINCAGFGQTAASANRNALAVSVMHIAISAGEPSLMCSSQNIAGAWVTAAQPLIQGVESFQVLYGMDGVTANSAVLTAADSVADRYLRADQITVVGNALATEANWRRVRSIRVGMVLRGPANSAQAIGAATYLPLGSAMTAATPGDDPGSTFVAAADGRLRQVVNFTVYMRNFAGI